MVAGIVQQMRFPPASVKIAAQVTLLQTMALATVMPVITRYLHSQLGISLSMAGLALLLHNGAMFAGQLAGGWLNDRSSPRQSLCAAAVAAALSAALPGLGLPAPGTVLAIVLLGAAAGLALPVLTAQVTAHWPEGGRQGYDRLFTANAIGLALGTAMGGALYGWSARAVFPVAGVLYLASLLPLLRLESATDTVQPGPAPPTGRPRLAFPLLALMAAMLLLAGVHVQWMTTFPVHAAGQGISSGAYGLLFLLGSVITILGQAPLGRFTRRFSSLTAQLLLGAGCQLASLMVLRTAGGIGSWLVGMGLSTVGGLLVWPGLPAAAGALAPAGQQGRYQGALAAAGSAGRMAAPLAASLLYERGGFGNLGTWLLACLLAAAVAIALHHKTRRGFAR